MVFLVKNIIIKIIILNIHQKKIKFYGQFEPQVDEFIFNRYFNDTNIKGVCIECGAYDEITNICYKFFEETIG